MIYITHDLEITYMLFLVHKYLVYVFIVLQILVKEVDRKCIDLFWSIPKEKSKVTLVAWDRVRQTKKMGKGVERKKLHDMKLCCSGETYLGTHYLERSS